MPISARELRDITPTLEVPGVNVSLIPLRVKDSGFYVDLINYDRKHLSQYGDRTAAKYSKPSDVARTIVEPENPFRLRFGIWSEGKMVGSINLEPLADNRAEIGYWIGKEHIGQGYATTALEAMTAFAFTELGYDELEAEAVWENEASRSVLRKAGFMETGEVKGRTETGENGTEINRLYVVYTLPKPEAALS